MLPQNDFYCITAMLNDMDELEEALLAKDISEEQYSLAINTSEN